MVMVSNATGIEVGYLAARYPDFIGHLYSPGGERGPWPFVPYAIDNGAWPAFKNGRPWSESEWRRLLTWSALSGQRPLWSIVPDAVGDKDGTLTMWARYSGDVARLGFVPAFAAQDGMTFDDVPAEAGVVFLGGSTEWKLAAIKPWCRAFPGRVHVGRVNTWERLWLCYQAGAVSVDGTGWFRKSERGGGISQHTELRRYLEHVSRKEAA
jgi:hypothetical protein